MLEQESRINDDYTIILTFSEPVAIQEKLSENVSISVSNSITVYTWDLETTDRARYNAYKLSINIEEDVPSGTTLKMEIET